MPRSTSSLSSSAAALTLLTSVSAHADGGLNGFGLLFEQLLMAGGILAGLLVVLGIVLFARSKMKSGWPQD